MLAARILLRRTAARRVRALRSRRATRKLVRWLWQWSLTFACSGGGSGSTGNQACSPGTAFVGGLCEPCDPGNVCLLRKAIILCFASLQAPTQARRARCAACRACQASPRIAKHMLLSHVWCRLLHCSDGVDELHSVPGWHLLQRHWQLHVPALSERLPQQRCIRVLLPRCATESVFRR